MDESRQRDVTETVGLFSIWRGELGIEISVLPAGQRLTVVTDQGNYEFVVRIPSRGLVVQDEDNQTIGYDLASQGRTDGETWVRSGWLTTGAALVVTSLPYDPSVMGDPRPLLIVEIKEIWIGDRLALRAHPEGLRYITP